MKKRHLILTTTLTALSLSLFAPVISSADSFSDGITKNESLIAKNNEELKAIEAKQTQLEDQLSTFNLQLKDLALNLATLNAQLTALSDNTLEVVSLPEKTASLTFQPLENMPSEKNKEQTSLAEVKNTKTQERTTLANQLKNLQDQQKTLKTQQTTTENQKAQKKQAITDAKTAIAKFKADQTAYYAKENLRNRLVAAAYSQLGKPYVWGGQGPDSFDCSGLMNYLYTNIAGLSIGSWTVPQESSGSQIAVSQAQVGDLLFWGSHGATTHVAMYIGNGQYIHAPKPGDVVKITALSTYSPDFAVNVLG